MKISMGRKWGTGDAGTNILATFGWLIVWTIKRIHKTDIARPRILVAEFNSSGQQQKLLAEVISRN
jgi:hypothetical protein